MTESSNSTGDQFTLQPDPTAAGEAITGGTAGGAAESAPAPAQEKPQSSSWMMARELIETVVLSLIIFLLIRQVVQNYRIENHSMEPNFFEGQFVLVNKLAYRLGQPARGDVIVFHNPQNTNEDYIKRIIGLPGDSVEVRNQTVYVNGQPLIENFPHNHMAQGEFMPPVKVGDHQLFVMGDNRPNSSDSRYFGPIDQDLVVGKAWLRIWPFNRFGIVEHEEIPLGPASQAPTPSAVGGLPALSGSFVTAGVPPVMSGQGVHA